MVARETPAIRAVATMLLPWVRSLRAVACYSICNRGWAADVLPGSARGL